MSDESKNEIGASNRKTDRRQVLRSVAAGGLSLGAAGTASASSDLSAGEIRTAVDGYHEADAVRAELAAEQELLEIVSDAGYIEEPTVDALGVETIGAPSSETDARVGVSARKIDGQLTVALTVRKVVDDGWLVFGVRPGADVSFAVFESADGDDEVIAGDLETASSHCISCGLTCAGCVYRCNIATRCTDTTREPYYV